MPQIHRGSYSYKMASYKTWNGNSETKRNQKSCPHATLVLSTSGLHARASMLLHRFVFCINRVIRHYHANLSCPHVRYLSFTLLRLKVQKKLGPNYRLNNGYFLSGPLGLTKICFCVCCCKSFHPWFCTLGFLCYWTGSCYCSVNIHHARWLLQMLLLANKNYIIRK